MFTNKTTYNDKLFDECSNYFELYYDKEKSAKLNFIYSHFYILLYSNNHERNIILTNYVHVHDKTSKNFLFSVEMTELVNDHKHKEWLRLNCCIMKCEYMMLKTFHSKDDFEKMSTTELNKIYKKHEFAENLVKNQTNAIFGFYDVSTIGTSSLYYKNFTIKNSTINIYI